jgi:RIO kinase 1
MKAPQRLQALIDEGLIDSVVRQLKSGKEADVYVVRCGEETCAPRSTRTPTSAASARPSTTPRTARSQQPAGARHGQAHALRPPAAGGRVAERRGRRAVPPGRRGRARAARRINFHEGVLLMDLVTDANGDAAPRLNDVAFSPEDAQQAPRHA